MADRSRSRSPEKNGGDAPPPADDAAPSGDGGAAPAPAEPEGIKLYVGNLDYGESFQSLLLF